jgi:hypothetical protein
MIKALKLTGLESSYLENTYGDLFYTVTKLQKPKFIVELGSYTGYSGLHMAAALRDLTDGQYHLTLVDLWDKYKYRHCSRETTRNHFRQNGLLNMDHCKIDFLNKDAFLAHTHFESLSIDLLHVDISNDGRSLDQTLSLWHNKLRVGGTLILEGGSFERDKVPWMLKYDKSPIKSFLKSVWFSSHYEYVVFEPYPSLTLALKRDHIEGEAAPLTTSNSLAS